MTIIASPQIQQYFQKITEGVTRAYALAEEARSKGLDPEKVVAIPLAKNMAERVVGLVSVVAPQVTNTAIIQRIAELEKQYGLLDWRVGFIIAEEVAKEKFCSFENKLTAMEVGIRVGFAYLTLGIVSAPLEGFVGLKIKKRRDGKEYFALQYAGPIRGAGGTAASTSVILSDYVRVKMGYASYDPDEKEVNRYTIEVSDYHERVTNLQYRPSDQELKFMVSHLPVEVDGDPTEQFEVSNYKDLPRIASNLIRGGVALVLAEGLCQKSAKLWKRLSKWGKEMGLEWSWLADFIKLKEEIHSSHGAAKAAAAEKTTLDKLSLDKSSSEKSPDEKAVSEKVVQANNTFIMDLVAGRPILTHPLGAGGFRLRYGRTRTTGFSATAIHPATMLVLNKFIAIGTQLKVERPGKAATVTVCDSLEGPIVRLADGSVLKLQSEEEAKPYLSSVEKILFLGDILFNYGDFSENGQKLVPAGYCPEWWALELEKALDKEQNPQWLLLAAKKLKISEERINELLANYLLVYPSWEEAVQISTIYQIPLHPEYTCYWKLASAEDVSLLFQWLKEGKVKRDEQGILKIILSFNQELSYPKKILDNIGLPHKIINKENIVIEQKEAQYFGLLFNFSSQQELEQRVLPEYANFRHALDYLNSFSPFLQRDKAGTFIGARMGRPEKAKMRHLTGSPQVMFPVGEEGGRLRSFQAALALGKINSSFPCLYCEICQKEMIYPSCEECGAACVQKYHCRLCGDLNQEQCRHGLAVKFKNKDIDINYYFNKAKGRIQEKATAELIKGIRGTSNKNHIVEHFAKGLLRAKHNIYVNKDGTTRYDCTELPITHFKPKEIKTSWEKLSELGYTHDIFGKELQEDEQLLEIKPQDIILPGFDSLDESAPKVLSRVAKFIDDLLVKFYHLNSYYNLKSEQDLIGHLVVGIAPHISAGLVGRIIGFSETQGLITHPMYHAGMRRDCLTFDTFVPICDGSKWEMVKIGDFVESLNPNEKLDIHGTLGKKIQNYTTIGYNEMEKRLEIVPLLEVTKHQPTSTLKITTENGRSIEVTPNHKFYTQFQEKIASDLTENDILMVPHNFELIPSTEINFLFIPSYYKEDDLMVSGLKLKIQRRIKSQRAAFCKLNNIKKNSLKIPPFIWLTDNVLWLIGLYIAEGCSRKREFKKGYYQVSFAVTEKYIQEKIKKTCFKSFNLKPSRETDEAVIYSSKLFYLFFNQFLSCGSKAPGKEIPAILLNLPTNRLKYLLQGYFDGDGSTDVKELRVSCDTVSIKLISQLYFVLARYGIYFSMYTSTRLPGKKVKDFYLRKNREVPYFTSTKITIPSSYCSIFAKEIGFSLPRKRRILMKNIQTKRPYGTRIKHDADFAYLKIKSIQKNEEKKTTYCLNVAKNHNFIANNFIVHNCDGDEAAVMLLMDALLNFSRQYLPEKRGAKTMDSPLVLTAFLNPSEVDDQVHGVDVVWRYPLEFYEAALDMKAPWEVKSGAAQKKVEQISDRLGTPLQYEQYGFTHSTANFNKGVQCSAYKTLPSMEEKLRGQMEIAQKIRAVNMNDVAKLVIQKHFIKDLKGNLRKFSMQQFRCVQCNEKYRRPPLIGKCVACGGRLIFTISEGSVIKYLSPSLMLAEKYTFSPYLKQTLNIIKTDIEHVFGKEKDKQVGLSAFLQ